VVFWRLRSGAEPEAAPVPLPRVLSRAHQALHETEAAIVWEWEALEAEHQRLSDWRTQLEERTKAASRQFASERSELERDRKDYKKDLQKVFAWELEAGRKEKRLAKKEALNQRQEVVTELRAKLSAMNEILEEQRVQQTADVKRIQNWERELEDKASNIALAEENLKEKDVSLDKRATDLAWREKDLAFREEMFERRDKLLDEHELEAEEKEKKLEERVHQFQAAQAALGLQAVEATRKALEDLQAEHRAGVQRIAAWTGEASTTLVPLGMSPIPVLELPTSISNALPVLDSTADCLQRLDQILGARLEAEGGRLCRAVIEYILTCFWSHGPTISLEPVITGSVADTEDAAREGVQGAVELVVERFQRDPADDE
jgi:chromosome segregation ATPase